jgi:hypothetical protein
MPFWLLLRRLPLSTLLLTGASCSLYAAWGTERRKRGLIECREEEKFWQQQEEFWREGGDPDGKMQDNAHHQAMKARWEATKAEKELAEKKYARWAWGSVKACSSLAAAHLKVLAARRGGPGDGD